jgi:hypothetical protein
MKLMKQRSPRIKSQSRYFDFIISTKSSSFSWIFTQQTMTLPKQLIHFI